MKPSPYGMSKRPPCNLGGLNVLVTRPAEQAAEFAEKVSAVHGRPVSFPTLEVLGPPDKQAARARLAGLRSVDVLVFVSANAVRYAFPMMPDDIPLDLQVAAVGAATARALEEIGLDPTLVPERMDSEGLLALPQLQSVEGQHILIVRGNGGRETLRETLQARGAQVDYVEVYRRRIPERNPANLIRNWDRLVDVVTATSAQILDNLFTLLGEEGVPLLQATPLIVPSRRIAEHAAQRGCERVLVADSAMDEDMLRALCSFAETEA
jgi:uroporphyrinogen-III synthase